MSIPKTRLQRRPTLATGAGVHAVRHRARHMRVLPSDKFTVTVAGRGRASSDCGETLTQHRCVTCHSGAASTLSRHCVRRRVCVGCIPDHNRIVVRSRSIVCLSEQHQPYFAPHRLHRARRAVGIVLNPSPVMLPRLRSPSFPNSRRALPKSRLFLPTYLRGHQHMMLLCCFAHRTRCALPPLRRRAAAAERAAARAEYCERDRRQKGVRLA